MSTSARTAANGRPPAAAATGADSMSTAIAPVAASCRRRAPFTTLSFVYSGPTWTVRPSRRSAPASSGADGHCHGRVRPTYLAGDHDVAGPGGPSQAAADPGHDERVGIRVRARRRGRPRRAHSGTHDAQGRPGPGDGPVLDRERCEDGGRHRCLATYLPSAEIGNTIRYR